MGQTTVRNEQLWRGSPQIFKNILRNHTSPRVSFIQSFFWYANLCLSGAASLLNPCNDPEVLPFTTNIGGITFPTALAQIIMVTFVQFAVVRSGAFQSKNFDRVVFELFSGFITVPDNCWLFDISSSTSISLSEISFQYNRIHHSRSCRRKFLWFLILRSGWRLLNFSRFTANKSNFVFFSFNKIAHR